MPLLSFKSHRITVLIVQNVAKGSFNNYMDKMRGGGGQIMSVLVHAQGTKTVHAGGVGESKNGKSLSMYVVVE